MCEYCEQTKSNGTPIFGNLDDGNVVAMSNSEYDGWCLERWENFEIAEVKKIIACPFCGRKLNQTTTAQ